MTSSASAASGDVPKFVSSNRPPPSVLELIGMRKWQRAMDVVAVNAEAVYGTNGRHHRLVIHELCKLAATPRSVRQLAEEISDDERDEEEGVAEETLIGHTNAEADPEPIERELYAAGGEQQDEPSASVELPNLTSGHLPNATFCGDDGCEECELIQNVKICELAQFMIDASHSLGPMRVILAMDDEDDIDRLEEFVGDSGGSYRFHDSILTVPDSTGKTPLHILCEGSCDISMMNVILGSTRENTGNPGAPTAISLITAKDFRGSTPLHYLAYSRQCPFSSLQLMMDFCKPVTLDGGSGIVDPTLCRDCDGDTPLHWALDGYMSPRRIKELIRHNRKALTVLNDAAKRPFDLFAANFIDADWKSHDVCGKEVWENIQAYLRVVFDETPNTSSGEIHECGKNESEWLPLHLLAGSPYDFPPIFADIAVHYCEKDLSRPSREGMLPLHLACRRRSINPDIPCDGSVAHKMLAGYPQAAYKSVTTSKRLALHLAVATQKPLSLITALIKVYPRSLNMPDPVSRLWPFVLAGVKNEISVGVSFTLLRADPSILQLAMKDERRKKTVSAQEMMRLMAEAELEDQSSRRIRRLTIRDPYN